MIFNPNFSWMEDTAAANIAVVPDEGKTDEKK